MREIFLYALLPVLIILILRKPFTGLLLYTGANIVRPEMFFWGGRQGDLIFKTFMGATLLSFFIYKWKENTRPLLVRELWLILWLSAAIVFSLVFSSYPLAPKAIDFTIEFFKLVIYGWLLIGLLDNADSIVIFEKVYLYLFSFLAVWGIEQHFLGNTRLEDFPLGDSNGVAALWVFAFPLAINMALHSEEKRNRVLGFLLTAAIFLAIISTQSRGGFLGLMVCSVFFFLRARHKMVMIAVILVLGAIAAPFASSSYQSRLSTITAEGEERDLSAGSRLVLWQAGMMIFRDHPFFGTGFMSFPSAKMEYKDQVDADEELLAYTFNDSKVAHSTYVQVLSEGGLFLMIPFSLLIIGSMTRNARLRIIYRDRHDPLLDLLNSIEAGLVGLCVCFIFLNGLMNIFLPLQVLVMRRIRDELTENNLNHYDPELSEEHYGVGNENSVRSF